MGLNQVAALATQGQSQYLPSVCTELGALETFMTPKKKKGDRATPKKIEIHPDAQRRFERAVDAAIKSGPIHRKPKPRNV